MSQAALLALGDAAADAVLATLAELGVDDAQLNGVSTRDDAGSALDGFELPVQAATVAGDARTTFVLTQSGATRLAAAAAGDGRPDLSLIGEALSTLASAAAVVLSKQLGSDPPGTPETRLVTEEHPSEAWEAGASVATVALTVCAEPAAIVFVLPAGLVEQLDAAPVAGLAEGEACGVEGAIAEESLREVKVRLWAELGRTRMALGRAVGLAPGEVVELDAAVDDPVVIFVNGVRLGSGHLVVGDDGEWAFRVAEVSSATTLHRELEGKAASETEQTDERKDG